MPFQIYVGSHFSWKTYLQNLYETPPTETQGNDGDTSSKNRKDLGIINYLSNFSLSTADGCEALRHLTSVKIQWTWNVTYQKLFDRLNSS